jgi:cephalosporin hydroxylase
LIKIDGDKITIDSSEGKQIVSLGSPEGFKLLSDLWLRSGWDTKYVYSFTWLGRPIIQLPEDMFRIQEIIFSIQPHIIIETGVAHGGSLIFYASLCKAMDHGRVIGIDIEIRPHNRKAIEKHNLSPLITLIEGTSIDPCLVDQVKSQINKGETTLILLDSCHTKEHVLNELKAYAPFVTIGSYIVAMDGIMEQIVGAPRTQPDWSWNNPKQAALEFVKQNDEFIIEEPAFLFNEGQITERITYWPSAFIKKIK